MVLSQFVPVCDTGLCRNVFINDTQHSIQIDTPLKGFYISSVSMIDRYCGVFTYICYIANNRTWVHKALCRDLSALQMLQV